MADFTWEFTMLTAQRVLANRNFATASVCRNEQKGFFIAGVFSLSPTPVTLAKKSLSNFAEERLTTKLYTYGGLTPEVKRLESVT